MERPKVPTRAKASPAVKSTTPSGGKKSRTVYERQLAARAVQERKKDDDFEKAVAQYNKDLAAFNAQEERISNLRGTKAIKVEKDDKGKLKIAKHSKK